MSGHQLTTALIKAAKTGWYHPIADLVAAGANVNSEGDGGFTPLIWAATKGNSLCIKELVIAGAKVNKGDDDGSTPLMFAAKH